MENDTSLRKNYFFVSLIVYKIQALILLGIRQKGNIAFLRDVMIYNVSLLLYNSYNNFYNNNNYMENK